MSLTTEEAQQTDTAQTAAVAKPAAAPRAPKPSSGYIVVNPAWDPVAERNWAWNPYPDTKVGLKEARAEQALAETLGVEQVVMHLQTTFTLVEDDGDD